MIDRESMEIIAFVILMSILFIAYQWWEDQNPFE